MRDRIKELRRVKASELQPHPRNWRTHPEKQRYAMTSILQEIGIADAVICRECEDGTLQLIDGHLRAETIDAEVPVLVLDVTEAEAETLILTLDPLASLAGTDVELLRSLMADVDILDDAITEQLLAITESQPIEDMLEPTVPANNARDEWKDMPEYQHEDMRPWKSIAVHFRNEEDLIDFARLVDQDLKPSTSNMWHPRLQRISEQDKAVVDES